jgi:hypothetical protein
MSSSIFKKIRQYAKLRKLDPDLCKKVYLRAPPEEKKVYLREMIKALASGK